jgi:hypothetical protein
MKNPKIILLFHFYSTLIFSCSGDKNYGLPTIKIPNKTDTAVHLSDVSYSLNTIQLETSENNLLAHIKDIKIYANKLFIDDGFKIAIFDINGKFIQVLGKKGQGPGEYNRVTNMAIDEDSGKTYLSDYKKLMVFNSEHQFVEERKLDYHLNYLKILDGELWIVSEEIGIKIGDDFANKTNIYKLDESYQISDTIPFRTIILDQKTIGGNPFRYWLSDLEDGLFMFMPVLTPENLIRDTLYQVIDNNIVVPAVKFQFERKQSLDETGYQTLLIYNIFNSSSYYLLEYDQDWKRYMFLYDKKVKKGYNLSEGLIDEDGNPVFLRPLDLKEDLFYYIKKFEFEDKTIEEKNPVIGIVKLN